VRETHHVTKENSSMLTRVLVVVLVGLMALPLSAGTPVAEAKSKRKTVVRTFTYSAPIAIPGSGPANPYPAPITVKGLKKAKILDVNVTLNGFTHPVPDDVDILLAASQLPGLNAIIMSDVGAAQPVNDITLTLDDAAQNALPDSGPLVSGTFLPTNASGSADTFPPPAPAPSGNSALSVFNGQNPNGDWQLFIHDNPGNGDGSLDGGWTLEITAQVKKKKK
jgi:hypothetical protein